MDVKTFIQKAVSYALNHSYSIAFWKNPLEKDIHLSISIKEAKVGKIEVESSKPGFCFAPFNNTALNDSIFFESDILYKITSNEVISLISNEMFNEKITTENNNSTLYLKESNITDTAQKDYTTSIKEAIKTIQSTSLKKVIVSKVKTIQKPNNIDLIEKFLTIAEAYPNAFVSLVSSKQTGTWIGASPEVLISIDKNNQFSTVALAGTQKAEPNNPLKNAVWTQKEIEEQALVARYVLLCFKSIRLREYEDIGPKTIKAGNLLHLKTDFTVNMNEVNFPNLGSTMLELLHPTSAVCGMPKVDALDFIKKHENHNRSFYSGFLGPINIENETHLYVNLRCAQITKNQVVFYAGAGITEDSDPEKEWLETEQKCAILGTIFN